jgi:hypothetical protein
MTVIGVGVAVFGERCQRLTAACVGIVEDRRGLDRRLPVDRQEVVAIARERIAFGA